MAQDAPSAPVYKCGGGSGITYTHVPCGGEPLGTKRVSRTFERQAPPQDRARLMARAQLPPETQQKCSMLEGQIRQEEARLKSKAAIEPPTPAEEGDLAIQRVHYREMRC
jgi:hypothetical protein